MKTESRSDAALDRRARAAAKRAGLLASRSRKRSGSVDNYGHFMLVDPTTNFIVAGERFDMTAEDVIAYFADD